MINAVFPNLVIVLILIPLFKSNLIIFILSTPFMETAYVNAVYPSSFDLFISLLVVRSDLWHTLMQYYH